VHTLVEALVLVVIVVFIFSGLSRDPDPAARVRCRLVGTFMVFPLLGFSTTHCRCFGLVLAIGLVVNDAIVLSRRSSTTWKRACRLATRR